RAAGGTDGRGRTVFSAGRAAFGAGTIGSFGAAVSGAGLGSGVAAWGGVGLGGAAGLDGTAGGVRTGAAVVGRTRGAIFGTKGTRTARVGRRGASHFFSGTRPGSDVAALPGSDGTRRSGGSLARPGRRRWRTTPRAT